MFLTHSAVTDYGYKYVTDDELLAKITVGMDKYGVSLVPNIVPGTLRVEPYTYKKTNRYFFLIFRFTI